MSRLRIFGPYAVGTSLLAIATHFPGVEAAIPPAPLARPAAETTYADCRLLLDAIHALRQDEALAGLNLGVQAHDHVITLWGPAPSAELAQRAQHVLERVLGVARVDNELFVEPADQPGSFDPPPPSPSLAEAPAIRPLPALPAKPEPPSAPTWRPAARGLAAAAAARERALPTSTAAPTRPDVPPGRSAEAGSPVPAPPLETVLKPPVTLLAPVPATSDPANVASAAETLRGTDARWAALRLTVLDGVVTVSGTAPSAEDLIAFATCLSKIPGVRRVVLRRER